MNWLSRFRGTPYETRSARPASFVGEQDGKPEREFKLGAAALLAQYPGVRRAYLARVAYESEEEPSVTLCFGGSVVKKNVVRAISGVFKSHFAASQHLDILFLSESQEQALAQVCRAFYSAG